MKRLACLLVLLLLSSASQGQMTLMGVTLSSGSSFQGPANVVASPTTFWGLRAVSGSYAASLGKLALICTPADAVCANVNSDSSGNFNLAGTPSLTCNNSGSICTIKTFFDQIGTACAGACDMTQATIANRPTLVVPGALNGCPTTSKFCANTVNGVSMTSPSLTLSQPLTMSAVYEVPSRTQDMIVLDNTGGAPKFWPGFGGANAVALAAISNLVATATDGVYHAAQGVACCSGNTGASSDMNVDGTPTTGTVGTATGFSTTLTLFDTTGFGLVGFFCEFGIWPVAFSSTNSTNMSSNQHGYWGF